MIKQALKYLFGSKSKTLKAALMQDDEVKKCDYCDNVAEYVKCNPIRFTAEHPNGIVATDCITWVCENHRE